MSGADDDTPAPPARTKTIEFPAAITFNNMIYTELSLRVPTIGEIKKAQSHLRGTDESSTQMVIALVAMVAAVPEPLVLKLDYDIVMEAGEFLMGFMPMQKAISPT
jgi:hypothetical protein